MFSQSMNRKTVFSILIVVLLLLLAGGVRYIKQKQIASIQKVHYHAGFLVYVDGKLQNFSDDKYMHIELCNDHEEKQLEGRELQEEKAHLHDNVGDVVHVHIAGATWGDLFKNINFSFPSDKPLTAYREGREMKDILAVGIIPDDSVILIVGNKTGIETQKYVTKEYIQDVEKKGESCDST